MFDPVKLFSDIATVNSLTFFYGARPFQNWEVTQSSLDGSETFLGMFPFTEQGNINNGHVDTWAVSTILWVGRKFDAPDSTFSSLDETETQKYDRRLKYLRAMMEVILGNMCDSSYVELNSARIFRELNKFDENTDVIGCEITFTYDPSYTN